MSCVSEMRSDIDISWQKDFKDISSEAENLTIHPNGTLSIKSVTDNSTGVYMCTALS